MKFRSSTFAVPGFILLSIPVFFPDNDIFYGICIFIGLVLIIASGRVSENRKELFVSVILLWIGQSICYMGFFREKLAYSLLFFAAFIMVTAVLGGAMFLEYYLRGKNHTGFSLIVFPAAYTALQIVLTECNFGFALNYAAAFMIIPVISQNISWLHEPGMTFILMMIISLTAEALTKNTAKVKIMSLSTAAMTVICLFLSGEIMLMNEKNPDYTINVAVATNQEMNFLGTEGKMYGEEDYFSMFTDAIKKASEMGADLLVLNEEYFEVENDRQKSVYDGISKIIMEYKVPVLFCVDVSETDEHLGINKAMFYDANGEILYSYVKNNLVPMVELGYYEDGEDIPAYITASIGGHEINVSYIICYDINDTFYVDKIPDETELLIVPSWDWDDCNFLQKRTFVRSIEANTTVLKHTFDGFTYVSGPYGLCGEMIDNRKEYETVKMIEVPIWGK